MVRKSWAITMTACAAMWALVMAEPMSKQELAAELLRVIGLERNMMAGATTMADLMIQQNPTLAPYRDVMLKWAESVMTWEAVAPRMSELYADRFTETELNELIAFYKTPTGQKALVEMPSLMQKGAAIGADLAKEHIPELQKMIRERAQELEKATQKPDPGGV